MADQNCTPIQTLSETDEPAFDIVFLHGLTGDPVQTWMHSNGGFWPDWLASSFPKAAVRLVGYPASIFAKWAEQEMNLHERAINILEDFANEGIGSRPLIFVTHSLGGLMAKEVLRAASEAQDEDWNAVAQNTRLVFFIATPHHGAELAKALKFIAPKISSQHIDLLSNNNGYLDALKTSYRNLAQANGVKTAAYFEKYKTSKFAVVVSAQSADPGVTECTPVALDSDHIKIVKLPSKEATLFRAVVRRIKRVLPREIMGGANGNGAFELAGYRERDGADRRDLQDKLIDAGREHEYSKANGLQSPFATQYHKLGLRTEAKDHTDKVLTEIEQRFNTHVYHAKICKGADDDVVLEALQAQVVDPICSKFAHDKGVTAKSVMQGVYYLTQMCHIRWDKE